MSVNEDTKKYLVGANCPPDSRTVLDLRALSLSPW